MVVKEVIECIHCGLGSSVDFCGQVIEGMHGGVID